MKRKMPRVSVVMPVYNVEKYLKESLASLISQSFKNFELICVDDGSTDKSGEILRSMKPKFQRMTILEQKNKGAGAARNAGIKAAKGKYIFFMDADDICDKRLLEKTVKRAEESKADIVCFHFYRMSEEGDKTRYDGYHPQHLPEGVNVFNYRDCPEHILDIVNPTPWNKLYKRSFIQQKELAFEEISSTNDITFASVSCAVAERIAVLDEALYTYRIGHGNTITTTKSKNLNNITLALDSAIRQVKELDYYEIIKPALASFVADNYVYSMNHYVRSYSSEDFKRFYETAHECALSDLFNDESVVERWYQEKKDKFKIIKKYGYEELGKWLKKKIIVSVTSYPKRISYVIKALESIYNQTYKADEVILWLAEDQFPGKESDVPEALTKLVQEQKLTIRWCDDLKPHKKYFYAIQENPDDLIITIDDDLTYEPKLIEKLMVSYLLHPEAVSAVRAHLMMVDEQDGVLPYNTWIREYDGSLGKPSMQLLCTGGAGALYPGWLFKNVKFDAELIKERCLYADDIWLKVLEVIADIPVVVATKYGGLGYIEGTQEDRLYDYNLDNNDAQLKNAVDWLDCTYGKGFFVNQILDKNKGENLLRLSIICPYYLGRISKLDAKLGEIRNTKAYKIGKPVTIYGRKARSVLQRLLHRL